MSSPPDAERLLAAHERVRRVIDVDLVRLAPRRKDPAGKVAAALAFNAALGDPQRAFVSIQVAGTSGKGSVCALLAGALHAAGLRTGLHVSPYLQAFAEKTWIAGRYADPLQLERALDRLLPVAKRFAADPDGPASVHGMASLAASYLAFAEAECEVVVMETGCGGRFDLVQGLRRAASVVTDLALDHQQALGETLEQIAWHKAGIVEAGVPAVVIEGPGAAVVAAEAARVGAPWTGVEPARVLARANGEWTLRLPAWGEVALPLELAGYRLRNLALAAATLDRLAADGWPVAPEHLVAAARRRLLPGRCEVVQEGPRVILDGAHNPHKLTALAEALADRAAAGVCVVYAATGARPPGPCLAALAPLAPRVVATELELYGKACVPAREAARAARALGLAAEAAPRPEDALARALASGAPTVVVTGSIFLAGRLRERWVPWRDVVVTGASWPRGGDA